MKEGAGPAGKIFTLEVGVAQAQTYLLASILTGANQTPRLIYSKLPVWRSGVVMQTEGYEC